jgi:hypothetical protein
VRSGVFKSGLATFVVAAVACGARTGLLVESSPDLVDGGDGEVDAAIDRTSFDADAPFESSPEADVFLEDVPYLDADLDVVVPLCSTTPPADDAGPCTGLACQVPVCGGSDTTLSGMVYAPNGTLPLYNVQIFIPNARLESIPRGVQCTGCGGNLSGSPITSTYSDTKGKFVLRGVPAGDDIPLVVQLGKWRRQTKIVHVEPCTNNALTDPNLTRLPKNQSEGNMPHIALTTGGCDQVGCILPQLGIDPSEFGYQADGFDKAVNVYNGDSGGTGEGTGLPATPADHLWSSPTLLATYDLAIFSCECSESLDDKGGSASAPEFRYVTDYLNAGGRIFTTDFEYTWYKYSPDPLLGGTPVGSAKVGIGFIDGGAPMAGNPLEIDTSFPKGAALAEWLKELFPTNPYAQRGEVSADNVFGNVQALNAETLTWARSGATDGTHVDPTFPRVFTVDTPVGAPAAAQCGRGMHLDTHVLQLDTNDDVGCIGSACYPHSCTSPLTPGEAMFIYFFFDLESCSETCN